MYRQNFFKTNKYNAVKQEYGGSKYDSKLEARFAADLDLRQKAKDIQSWERQYKIELRANGKLICNYYCDFRVLENDGSYTLIETKGYETDIYRFKRRLLEALWLPDHPDHEYLVVKEKSYYTKKG